MIYIFIYLFIYSNSKLLTQNVYVIIKAAAISICNANGSSLRVT